MELVLGVVDIPYVDQGGTTTAEIAGHLENKYGVLQRFAELHHDDIEREMCASVADTISNITAGAPVGIDPFVDGMDEIKAMFTTYIEREELAGVAPGVPTQAALDGKSKRFKRLRGPRRPSFIDSGLYQASFKPWIEGA